ncbi:MAG: methyltransferase domain-containing protein [Candidatus Bathyarchaeia archaeon]
MYMTLVIHHLENKELALQETYRLLKKDGSLRDYDPLPLPNKETLSS